MSAPAGRLRQVVVLSGKGGTGKTSTLAAFACHAASPVLADCDVDAANLHLLLAPRLERDEAFVGAKVAVRDEALCTRCGVCERTCRFDAITAESVRETACEGCGACVVVCPTGALRLEPVVNGHAYISATEYGPMAHAKLLPGAESSGKLVTRVRELAAELALRDGRDLILIDGPPGIGCTVTAALVDADAVVLVTEPTLSAMHDLERVAELAGHFGIPTGIVINKADLNTENTRQLREFTARIGARALGELPFDATVPRAISARTPLPRFAPESPAATELARAWGRTKEWLGLG